MQTLSRVLFVVLAAGQTFGAAPPRHASTAIEGVQPRPPVIGPRSVPPEALQGFVPQKAGEFYDQEAIDQGAALIRGYVGGSHQPRVVPEAILVPDRPGFAPVPYQVVKGQVKAGQVIIVGNERTSPNVILRPWSFWK